MKLRNIISKNINEYLFEAQKIKTNINDNFWKWFGDSKIIENGEPISVYHQNVSGDNNFNEFIPQSFGTFGQNSMFYFAKDKNWVKNFVKTFNNSNKEKPRVFYLSIQNPLNLQNLLLTPKEWISFLENKYNKSIDKNLLVLDEAARLYIPNTLDDLKNLFYIWNEVIEFLYESKKINQYKGSYVIHDEYILAPIYNLLNINVGNISNLFDVKHNREVERFWI
jgi:hypothetical protein